MWEHCTWLIQVGQVWKYQVCMISSVTGRSYLLERENEWSYSDFLECSTRADMRVILTCKDNISSCVNLFTVVVD